MKQLQFFKITTGVLLALNLGLVAFFFLTKPKAPMDAKSFNGRLVDILDLDKDQHDAFLNSARGHNQQMDAISLQQRDLIRPYFNSLVDPSVKLDLDSVLLQIQGLEGDKVTRTYTHFQEVKALLRDDQQDDFEEFMNKALQRLLLDRSSDNPPPRK